MSDSPNIKFFLLLMIVVFVYLVGFDFNITVAYEAFIKAMIEILKFIGVK